MASSSRPEAIWQPTFKFNDGPLPTSTNLKAWAQGQGERVAQSLVHDLLLLEDVQFFSDKIEELLARRLQWHIITVVFYLTVTFIYMCVHDLLLQYQAAQLTHIINERLKELVEDAEQEKALKDVATATAKEKGKAAEAAKKKAQSSEKARLVAERNLAEAEERLGGVELKLAKAASLNLAQVDEIANLKAALKACKTKWYNVGFMDAENFVEPIVHQAQSNGFGKGGMAALQAMGVPEDSPLRNPEQILYSAPPPPVQSQAGAADEEDTPSMRQLVRAIDDHAKDVDLEVTNNLNTVDDAQGQQPPTADMPGQQAIDATQLPPTKPSI